MSKRVIIITVVLVMSVAAGAAVPALGQPHAWRGQAAITPAPAITTRYQVIDDLLTMQQRINRLERELRDARNEIDTLELLRAHDIYAWRTARAEDQRRIVALEWAVQGQPWPARGER